MPPTMVNVADNEVKERLDELLTAAEGGQTVAITRNGKAVAQMAPVPPPVPNGEYDDDEQARRLNALLAKTDEEKEISRRNMEEVLRLREELQKNLKKEGCTVTREEILEIIAKMRGR